MKEDQLHGREIPLREYYRIHQALLQSTTEQRKAMPGMEAVRVEMIVAATIFVSFVLRSCQIKHLHHSEFALKEGVISELVGL
jgi:exopolyphosphatase/guanosine-5'-triphosphate,3'-diphosphate pyrophosphatase